MKQNDETVIVINGYPGEDYTWLEIRITFKIGKVLRECNEKLLPAINAFVKLLRKQLGDN